MHVAPETPAALPPWQRALQAAVRAPAELLRLLELDAALLPGARQAAQAFPRLVREVAGAPSKLPL